MNSLIRRAAMAAFLAGTASAAVLALVPAYAAQQPAAPAKPTLGRAVGTPLVAAQKAFQAMDYATALAKGKEADAVATKTPFEEYSIAKLLAVTALRQNDLATAEAQYVRAIGTNAAPEEEKAQNYDIAMRLTYNAKNYAKAIEYGTEKAKLSPLDDLGQVIMTQSYYNMNDFAATERFAQQALASAKAAGTKPQVAVVQMLMNAQIKQNNMAGARDTAVELAAVDPTPDNWTRAIDQSFPANATDHQLLNLYRLKRLTKSMAANDYLAGANAALKLGLPTEAKEIFAEGIAAGVITQAQTGEAFGQANTMSARDQAALAEFERAAAAAANGETDVKLGETLWVYKRYPDAEAALRRGLQKGGIKDLADAQMTLGIILLTQGKKQEAVELFTQAGQSPALQPVARVWTIYAQTQA